MELNAIQNLMILANDLRQGAEILQDKSTNQIVKKALLADLDALNKEIEYLHEYMKEVKIKIKQHEENEIAPYWDKPHEVIKRLSYWHEIIKKVDQNEISNN